MTYSAPIGVFDSGIGGLSVLKNIRQLLPAENLVYLGDTAYVPYGDKSAAQISDRARQITQYFINEHHTKAVVVACNTATAAAVSHLRQQFSLPIIGMEPGVKPAVERSCSATIGILATANTLKSEKFNQLVSQFGNCQVVTQHCMGLVELIEQGDLQGQAMRDMVQSYIQPLLDQGADTIVLGCTHYPYIKELIQSLVGDQINVLETGEAVARQLKNQLQQYQLINPSHCQGDLLVFSTSSADSDKQFSQFWQHKLNVKSLVL